MILYNGNPCTSRDWALKQIQKYLHRAATFYYIYNQQEFEQMTERERAEVRSDMRSLCAKTEAFLLNETSDK